MCFGEAGAGVEDSLPLMANFEAKLADDVLDNVLFCQIDSGSFDLVLLMSDFGLADDRTVFGEIDIVLERERAADETVGALFYSRDACFFDGKPIVLACGIENGIPDREVEMRRIEFA